MSEACAHKCCAWRGQKRAPHSLDPEWWAAVSHPRWVLGNQLDLLQEPYEFLTDEPPLQPQIWGFNWRKNIKAATNLPYQIVVWIVFLQVNNGHRQVQRGNCFGKSHCKSLKRGEKMKNNFSVCQIRKIVVRFSHQGSMVPLVVDASPAALSWVFIIRSRVFSQKWDTKSYSQPIKVCTGLNPHWLQFFANRNRKIVRRVETREAGGW